MVNSVLAAVIVAEFQQPTKAIVVCSVRNATRAGWLGRVDGFRRRGDRHFGGLILLFYGPDKTVLAGIPTTTRFLIGIASES